MNPITLSSNTPRAIFLDIDGTILPDGREIPTARVLDALRRAQNAGHFVFINTGRALGNLPEKLLHCFPFDGYVTGCGNYILWKDTLLFRNRMSPALCTLVAEHILSQEKKIWCAFEGETGLLQINSPWLTDSSELTKATDLPAVFADFPVTKIDLGYGKNDPFPDFGEYRDQVTLFCMETYTEVCPLGCSKATGIDRVLAEIGLPLENSIAIGDSPNDLQMLEHAGLGIAMGNASPEVKEKADLIAPSCDEDGVATILEQLLGI